MTLRPTLEGASTTKQKVNFGGKAPVALKANLDALRSLYSTAGYSNVIAHPMSDVGEADDFYLAYHHPKGFDWAIPGTADVTTPDPENYVLLGFQRALEYPALDFSVGKFGLGGLANAESVREFLPPTRLRSVNANPISAYGAVRRQATEGRRDALARISKDLDATAAVYSQDASEHVLGKLADAGVGQLTIARAVGVTPTAIRKWRRGDEPKPDHRGRLARFAALHSVLAESGMHDPAGWLEVPISSESTVTPLDLFAGGRPDLAVLLGARLMDPQEALDAYDPKWRQSFPIDPDYRIIMIEDGSRSAVPRRGGAD